MTPHDAIVKWLHYRPHTRDQLVSALVSEGWKESAADAAMAYALHDLLVSKRIGFTETSDGCAIYHLPDAKKGKA